MIRIAISQAAFDAIAATLPLGSVGYENATNEKGERYIWLEPKVVDRLRALRESWRELQRRYPAAGSLRRAALRLTRATASHAVVLLTARPARRRGH
jgi:hypothetical protein